MTSRHDILLALAKADGQPWESIAEATEHTAEMMYGKQADAVELMVGTSTAEQQRLRADGLAADLAHTIVRLTEYELHQAAWEHGQDTARKALHSDWWKGDNGVWHAEAGLDMDNQRLVAHGENTDPLQLVKDLRALSVAALDLAGAIDMARMSEATDG